MKFTSDNIINQFLHEIEYQQGVSSKTLHAYKQDLESFFKWFVDTEGGEPQAEEITSIDIREYQSHLQNIQGLKPSSVNRRITGLKMFLKWALRNGCISRMPEFPKAVRQIKPPPKSLERKDQNRLLRELEKRDKPRDTALVRLLLSCGLRVGEAIAIKTRDLDIGPRHGTLIVRKGKGDKWREVPVPPAARKAVWQWLEVKNSKHPGSEWLFPGRDGDHISIRHAEGVVRNVARFAGMDIHPHVLRHTAAMNMLRSGSDLATVASILGHENISTTAIYTKPQMSDMKKTVER